MKTTFLFLLALATAPLGATAHRYEGDIAPNEASPAWQEARKGGGGTVTLVDGRLRLEVPAGRHHFYAIGVINEGTRGGGADAYDGSTVEGTTIDFALTVASEDPSQDAFAIQAGNGTGSVTFQFRPDGVSFGSRSVGHDVTTPDHYRLSFRDGKASLYSARQGVLFEQVPIHHRYPTNAISLGTRQSLDIRTPVAWELDYIRWRNDGAQFEPPVPPQP